MASFKLLRAVSAFALWLGFSSLAPARAEAPCPTLPPIAARHYAGHVDRYIADLKTSFPEHKLYSPATALSEANYRAVLDGLAGQVGVNGVRLPIVPAYADASSYPRLHRDVLEYARSLGLAVYASPMSVGMQPFRSWSDDRYASWIAGYAAAFKPDVLSPFNEAGLDDRRIARIVGLVRAKLTMRVSLMGPDRQHVGRTAESFARHPSDAALFDIVGSHNAARDDSATAAGWRELVALAGGRPVWSSENPALWRHGQVEGLPGMDQAVEGGVEGIVAWMAKPALVDDGGRATAKACEIATGLIR